MAYTESQKKASIKYMAEKTDDIRLRVKRGLKEKYREEAGKRGMSMTQFIIECVERGIKEEIKMREELWSVELEANTWNDDTFNGTYDECIQYCEDYDYKIDGKEARLAHVVIEDGVVIDTIEIVNEV